MNLSDTLSQLPGASVSSPMTKRHFTFLRHGIVALALSTCGAESVYAAAVALAADRDTTIFQNNVNNAGGGGPAIFSGTNGTSSPRRALISFDLSSIPAGSIITNVQLTLTLGLVSGGGSGTATIGLFGVAQNWGEGTANSGVTGIAGSGQGAVAGTGDATWNAAMFPGAAWASAGGDHAATASASLFLGTNTINTAFTWLSTPQLVADAQGWLNNPATNFGWQLINANETSGNSLYGFYSSEWRTFAGGNASQEPVLQVTYTVPEPGTCALIAGMAAASLARRRRHASAA